MRKVFYSSEQCFSTFFDSWHPYIVMKIFGGTPNWFNRYIKIEEFEHLALAHDTLMCRGTTVGNHWLKVSGPEAGLLKTRNLILNFF